MSALDVVAHNLANANTTGFRAQRQLFSSVLASAQGDAQYGILSDTRTDLTQGALEGSNISPVEGAVELVKLQRQADMMQRVIQIFNSDFNRTAIEQVARPL